MKRKYLQVTLSLAHNLTIAYWYGCYIAIEIITMWSNVSIHYRNIHNLEIEIFKVKNDLSLENFTDTVL